MIYERSLKPSADTPYQEYPAEWAKKTYYVRSSTGETEPGWIGLGSFVQDGRAYTRVGKPSLDESGRDVMSIEDIQTDILNQFDTEERDRRRAIQAENLGHRAAELTVADTEPSFEAPVINSSDEIGRNISRKELWKRVGYDPNTGEFHDAPTISKQGELETIPEDPERVRLERLFAFPEARGRDKWGNDLDVRMKVTPESSKDASMAFRYLEDDTVRGLIKRYAGEKWREDDMAAVLRGNKELRIELGAYLLAKLDTIRNLPSRFYGQQLKNPNEGGYEGNMTSQEYAALLAVSMLDGTFKAERTRHDPIEMQYGEVIRGQHRYAALRLLDLDRSPLADIKQV